jgi:hypothetical protein
MLVSLGFCQLVPYYCILIFACTHVSPPYTFQIYFLFSSLPSKFFILWISLSFSIVVVSFPFLVSYLVNIIAESLSFNIYDKSVCKMVSHIKRFLFLGLSWDYYYTTLVIYVGAESVLSVFSNKNLDESTSEAWSPAAQLSYTLTSRLVSLAAKFCIQEDNCNIRSCQENSDWWHAHTP